LAPCLDTCPYEAPPCPPLFLPRCDEATDSFADLAGFEAVRVRACVPCTCWCLWMSVGAS
jgi:hypothetical protein